MRVFIGPAPCVAFDASFDAQRGRRVDLDHRAIVYRLLPVKHFHAPLLARPRFSPNEALCLAHILAAEPAGEIEPLLVKSSLALRLDPDLGSDHDHDAHRLRLCGELVRVELVRQPAEIIVDAVERHAEEMLDIRGWRPPVSARRLVGADDTRQVRESDDAAARARVADGGSARA